MLEILKFVLSGFWVFCGFTIIVNVSLYYIVNMIVKMWSRFMRHLNISKHGWPPPHLDGDGDFKTN